jgi:cell division protein FtsB
VDSSIVLESKETGCEEERGLETLRLEGMAMEAQFMYQLESAKTTLEIALKSKRKGEKRISKLEKECRRLEHENSELKEEIKTLKQREVCKSEAAPQCSSASTCITEPDNCEHEEQQTELTTVSHQLTDLQDICKDQANQFTNCLATLRNTRHDNALLLDAVCRIQEVLVTVHYHAPRLPTIESLPECEDFEMYIAEEGEYCRLLDEIQDMTEGESVIEESLFHVSEHMDDSYLIAQPLASSHPKHVNPTSTMRSERRDAATQTKLRSGVSTIQRAYTHFLSSCFPAV